jgi:hypothetical protein
VDLVRDNRDPVSPTARTVDDRSLYLAHRHADPDWADFEPEVSDELEKAYQQAVTANDGTIPHPRAPLRVSLQFLRK